MPSEGRAAQVRLRSRSDTATVTCGAAELGPPPGDSGEPRPEPQIPGSRSRALNSPSTVFFLKRDAMVSGRAGAAQLGPVRSGRVLGKGQREGRSLGLGAAGSG